MNLKEICEHLNMDLSTYAGSDITVTSPIDGENLDELRANSEAEVNNKIAASVQAFRAWRDVPGPKRGELIRELGNALRKHKETLAQLVTLECGKIIEEGRGEVQEMIDICDFAVGLSRQLHGLTIASERPNHSMQENWLPLGPVGIITAFNFPVAVWAWNTALAIVCGDSVLWKPSEKTLLTAIACQHIFDDVASSFDYVPSALSQCILGYSKVGEQLVNDCRIPLISATGSTRMGKAVGPKVAQRFGKSLLELGGNNAVIVSKSADLALAIPSILFGAVGTAGQRCTTTRRVFVHKEHYDELKNSLQHAYTGSLKSKIGDPRKAETLIGPLIDQMSYKAMQDALSLARSQGAEVQGGTRVLEDAFPKAYYVEPALAFLEQQTEIVYEETFAPILYVMPYDDLLDAIELNNSVAQGLSSAIFTTDVREAEVFKKYSDCGIANVNIGTSGAEIGGAFGGEKETGGGRESGSDSWKFYMRRQTSTTYYGVEPPALAQGIKFDVD